MTISQSQRRVLGCCLVCVVKKALRICIVPYNLKQRLIETLCMRMSAPSILSNARLYTSTLLEIFTNYEFLVFRGCVTELSVLLVYGAALVGNQLSTFRKKHVNFIFKGRNVQ
jgi:hypothetical protein